MSLHLNCMLKTSKWRQIIFISLNKDGIALRGVIAFYFRNDRMSTSIYYGINDNESMEEIFMYINGM